MEIPHDILVELLRFAMAALSCLSVGLVTLRYYFRSHAKVESQKAGWMNAAIDRFEKAIARLEGDAKDHRVITNENTRVTEGLKGRLETLQPQVDRMMETIPPLLDLMGKVHAFFERRYPPSITKTIAPDVTRVEEINKSKGEKKS